jgi:outer membrane protein, heavy metal efflux system
MIFLFLQFFFIHTNANANLSEKDILENVLQQFPSIKMAQDDISIAKGEETAARGAFDILLQGSLTKKTGDYDNSVLDAKIVKPTSLFGLDLYAGYKKGTGQFAVYDGDYQTLDKGEWNVGLKLPLLRDFLIDERRARLQKTNLAIDQRQFQLQAVELEQVKNALHRYWDWMLASKRILIQKGLLDTAQQRDVWLHKRTKAGDIARFERNDNLRSILQRKSFVMQSELNLEQSIAELIYYINDEKLHKLMQNPHSIPDNDLLHFKSVLLTKTVPELTTLALQQRPELKGLNLQIEQNKIDESLQNNKFLPKLDIQAQYSKDEGAGSTSLDDNNFKTMVNVEVPLQYRAIRGRQSQIRSLTQKMMNQRQFLEQRISADIKIFKKNLQIALQRRDLAKEEWALAQKLEQGERIRFSHGETNVLIVNLREQASAEAELRLAETSVEALKQLINLKVTVGEIPRTQ